jgi:hypothetical protein
MAIVATMTMMMTMIEGHNFRAKAYHHPDGGQSTTTTIFVSWRA